MNTDYWMGLAADYFSAYLSSFNRQPTKNALVLAMCVAEHETNNGRAWPGTNNFGAVQLRPLTVQEYTQWKAGQLKPGDYNAAHDGVLHIDTHPTPAGPAPYPVFFAAFATRVEGIAYFLKTLWRLSAGACDVPDAICWDVAKAMYMRGYYEGAHGGGRPISMRKDPLTPAEAANVQDYSLAMQNCKAIIEPNLTQFMPEPVEVSDADTGLPGNAHEDVKT